MLNIGPPTDGHAAVMYGGGEGGGVTLRAGCRIVADRPRAIRSTRVSTVRFDFGLCVFSRDACWFRAKGGINFSCSWLALSYLFLQFGDEDLE